MKRILLAALSLLVVSATVYAAEKTELRASLTGIQEVASLTVITDATGTFTATINNDSTITYTLTYKNLSSAVKQAHIHIGATKISGGVSIFLCSNLGNGPAGTPACPDDATHSGSVSHTVSAADVIGPAGQGVPAGDFKDAVRAIVSHVTYANVHTANFPAGEIRGQIRSTEDEDDELPGADSHHHHDHD
ncbi:MAG TPA: CHRD domain-containing protein [Candidatus Angelobacter sp.]